MSGFAVNARLQHADLVRAGIGFGAQRVLDKPHLLKSDFRQYPREVVCLGFQGFRDAGIQMGASSNNATAPGT